MPQGAPVRFALFCLIGAFLFISVENLFVDSFQNCVAYNHADDGNQYRYYGASFFVVGHWAGQIIGREAICTFRFVDRHNGLFAVVAGFAVAGFTYTLWYVSRDAVGLAQIEFETTQRAFVFVDSFNKELTTEADRMRLKAAGAPIFIPPEYEMEIRRFAVQPVWGNSGSTPTRAMRFQMDWQSGGDTRIGTYRNVEQQLFIAPKAKETTEFIDMPGGLEPIIRYNTKDPLGLEPLLLIWGRADYMDIFGDPHWIEWCYRIRPSRPQGEKLQISFIQYGEYNDSDDGQKHQRN